jgi:hypothetical protein
MSPAYCSPEVRRAAGPSAGGAGDSFRQWLTGNDVFMLAHVLLVLAFRAALPQHGPGGAIWYPCEPDKDSGRVPGAGVAAGSRMAAYAEDTAATALADRLRLPENEGLRSTPRPCPPQ